MKENKDREEVFKDLLNQVESESFKHTEKLWERLGEHGHLEVVKALLSHVYMDTEKTSK